MNPGRRWWGWQLLFGCFMVGGAIGGLGDRTVGQVFRDNTLGKKNSVVPIATSEPPTIAEAQE